MFCSINMGSLAYILSLEAKDFGNIPEPKNKLKPPSIFLDKLLNCLHNI